MGLVVQEAVGAEKEALAVSTGDGGRASCCRKVAAMGLVAAGTFPAWATVMLQIVAVKGFFTVEAKIDSAKEATQGMTYMVMVLDFDQAEEFVLGLARTFKDHLVAMVGGHHHNLVVGQYNLK